MCLTLSPFQAIQLLFLGFNMSDTWRSSKLWTNLVQSSSHNTSLNTPTSEKAKFTLLSKVQPPSGDHTSLSPRNREKQPRPHNFSPTFNSAFQRDGCFCFHHNATFQVNEKHTTSPRKQQPLLQTIPLTSYTTELRKQSSHFLTPSPPPSTLLAPRRPRSAPKAWWHLASAAFVFWPPWQPLF